MAVAAATGGDERAEPEVDSEAAEPEAEVKSFVSVGERLKRKPLMLFESSMQALLIDDILKALI